MASTVGAYGLYDERIYDSMTFDHRRNAAFRAAIVVQVPGRSVVDIGAGKDLVLTRMCLEAGARHVYAIERDRRAFERANALLGTLPHRERVTLIFGDSTTVQLPEPVEICVSELLGVIGGCEGGSVILNQARQKFLQPGGAMIPTRCLTEAAAVQLPDEVANTPAFSETSWGYAERIFQKFGRCFDLRVCIRHVPRSWLLSSSAVLEDLDFCGPTPTQSARELSIRFHRSGRLDGLLAWLRLYTSPSHELVSLDDPESNWLPLFLPLRGEAIAVSAGDTASLVLETTPSDDGVNPDYRLNGQLFRQGRPLLALEIESLHHPHTFCATPFHRRLFPPAGVRVMNDGPPQDPWNRFLFRVSQMLPQRLVQPVRRYRRLART